jgi:hypothetical protein
MSTTTSISIPRRFNGPDHSANGGYACGRFAAFVDGPAEVTLRSPPPLDRDLAVTRDGEEVSVWDGETLVGVARPARAILLDPPVRPSVEEADDASTRHPGRGIVHPLSNCFVCGPARASGLSLSTGPLADHPEIGAAVLRPDESLPNDDGVLAPELLWAALDCPSFAPPMWAAGRLHLLGRLTAELVEHVRVGETLVAVGWSLLQQGRKYQSAAALVRPDGTVVGRSRAVWIAIGEG